MKISSGQKIRIGLFVVIGLFILFLGIFLIGSQKSMFNSTFSVYGVFKNVSGLMVGNNVRFAGINVGVVEGINIVTDSSVRVDLTVNDNVKKFIKKDAKMSIGSDGLMGDKLVVITPGKGGVPVQNGDQLASVNPVDVDKIVTKLTQVADNAASLTSNLNDIVTDVNHGKGTLGRLLHSDKMARDLESTVSQTKHTISSVGKSVQASTSTLNEDLKAAQHNFLLRGYFKKKEKHRQDSIKKAEKHVQDSTRKADKKTNKQ